MIDPPRNGTNRHYRAWLLKATQSRRQREAILDRCRHDLLFYVNSFVWQYNPTKDSQARVAPFVTWPFQDGAFQEIQKAVSLQYDLAILKSREMGASWMCLILMKWLVDFSRHSQFLLVSRSAEAVDSESPNSLFWKLDFIGRYLPDWMRAKTKRRDMYYANEETGGTITGEASTGRAGVGGRATAIFIDEFSQIREAYDVLHRTSDTSPCRIFNFTYTGVDNAAYEIGQRVDIRKVWMHWTQHPDKCHGLYRSASAANRAQVLDTSFCYPADFSFVLDGTPSGGPFPGLRSPWYDDQCRRKGSARAVAMDLDINPQGSQSQFFDPQIINVLKATYAVPHYWEGDLDYDPLTGRPHKLIEREGGLIRLWVNPDSSGKVPQGRYTMGADIAGGMGATPSCITVVNALTGEKVLEYADSRIYPDKLAPLAVALCWLFQDGYGEGAKFCWEHAGPGAAFGKEVIELGYRNVYYRQPEGKLSGLGPADTPGWYPNADVKRTVLEDYRAALYARQFVNRSLLALEECMNFRYNAEGRVEHAKEPSPGDPSGARENHGDRTIADALAWKMARGQVQAVRKQDEEKLSLGSLAWRRRIHDDERRRAEEY